MAQNRRARHEYEIIETLECGIALVGSEVKSLRNGKLSLEVAHIADICREADHWAGREGRKVNSVADVTRALEERKVRLGPRDPGALS